MQAIAATRALRITNMENPDGDQTRVYLRWRKENDEFLEADYQLNHPHNVYAQWSKVREAERAVEREIARKAERAARKKREKEARRAERKEAGDGSDSSTSESGTDATTDDEGAGGVSLRNKEEPVATHIALRPHQPTF